MGAGGSRLAPLPPNEARARFSDREREALQRGFERLTHAAATRGVTLPCFRQLVLADVPDVPEPLVRRMFAVADFDRDGALSVDELTSLLCVLCRGKLEERTRFLFAVYDELDTGSAMDRASLDRFASMLQDNRLSPDAVAGSLAFVDELFAGAQRDTVTPQRFAECAARFLDAPLVSWPAQLGQRLLAPLFAVEQEQQQQEPRAAARSPSLALPTTVSTTKSPAAFTHVPRPPTPVARQLSTQQQLSEGDRFLGAFVPPTGSALVPGSVWFVVSATWFDAWRRFVGLARFDPRSGASQLDLAHLEVLPPPGPIDNAPLLVQDSLRHGLEFGSDFIVLNEEAFALLRSAHGGGPTIARSVIVADGLPELELFPLHLRVRCAAEQLPQQQQQQHKHESKMIVLSRRATVRQLAAAARDAVLSEPDATAVAHMPEDALRVWCVLGSLDAAVDDALVALTSASAVSPRSNVAGQSVALLGDWDASLEDTDIEDGRTVVLEICGGDGRWPLASAETLRSLRPRAATEEGSSCAAQHVRQGNAAQPLPPVLLLGGARGKHVDQDQQQLAPLSSSAAPPLAPRGAVERRSRLGSVMSARRAGPGARIPGNVGLCNLGNTCFMSAAVQCLLHTPPLKQYFLDGAYARDINVTARDGSKGRLAEAFAELVRFAWGGSGGGGRALAPRRFKRELGKHDKRFAGAQQQDSQEMLSALMDALAQDLNRVRSKAYVELKDSDGRDDEEVAREWWLAHLRRELSVVTALFTGQFKAVIACEACGYESARFEPFQTLSLPLPESPLRTVTVHVVFADALRPPLLVSVRVDKHGTFADIRDALLSLQPGVRGDVESIFAEREGSNGGSSSSKNGDEEQQLQPGEDALTRPPRALELGRLALAFVFNRQVHTVTVMSRRIATLRDRDPVYAFELPRVPTARGNADEPLPKPAEDGDDDLEEPAAEPEQGSKKKQQQQQEEEEEVADAAELELGSHVLVRPSRGSTAAMPTLGVVSGERARAPAKKGGERRFEVTVHQPGGHDRVLVVPRSGLVVEPLPALLFRVAQREWHKHACYFLNPLRPATVGFPFLLRLRPDRITGKELYAVVAAQLRAGAGRDADAAEAQEADVDEEEEELQQESSNAGGAAARGLSDAAIRAKYGFKLVLLSELGGGTCGCCSWMTPCDGCALPPDDALLSTHTTRPGAFAVDWGLARTAASARRAAAAAATATKPAAKVTSDEALTLDLVDKHESVDAARREDLKAMPLTSLLEDFVQDEQMTGAEQVRCSKCKADQDHHRKIELWRAPPVLVVHLKRFDRQRKLLNLVEFPLEGLDLREFIAVPSPARPRRSKKRSSGSSSSSSKKTPAGGDDDDDGDANDGEDIIEESGDADDSKSKQGGAAEGPQEDGPSGAPSSSVSSSSSSSSSSSVTSEPDTEALAAAAAQEEALALAEKVADSEFAGLRSYGGRKHGGVPPEYDLFAVVEHSGSLGGGHYIAKARSSLSGDWFVFDDAMVTRIEDSAVQTSRAYLLFYMRRDVLEDPSVRRLFPCEDMSPKEAAARVKELVPPAPGPSPCSIM